MKVFGPWWTCMLHGAVLLEFWSGFWAFSTLQETDWGWNWVGLSGGKGVSKVAVFFFSGAGILTSIKNQTIFYRSVICFMYVSKWYAYFYIFLSSHLIVSTIRFSDIVMFRRFPKNACRSAARTVSRTVAEKYGLWQLQLSIHGIVAWCETWQWWTAAATTTTTRTITNICQQQLRDHKEEE